MENSDLSKSSPSHTSMNRDPLWDEIENHHGYKLESKIG